MPINEKITLDESQVREAIKNLIEDYKKLEMAQKMSAKSTIEQNAANNASAKTLDGVIGKIDNLVKKEEDLTKTTTSTKDALKAAAKETTIFGVNIGSTITQLQSKIGALRGLQGALSATSKGFNVLKFAIASTGIGLLIVALGSLVSYFSRTQKGIDLASRAFNVLGSVVGNITDRLSKLGGALIDLFKGNFKDAINGARDAVTGLGAEILKDARAVDELTKRTQALRDANRELSVEEAKINALIEEKRFKSKDLTLSEKERADQLREAIKLEDQLGEKRLKLAQENLDIIKAQNDVNESLTDDLDKAAEAEIALSTIRADIARKNRERFTEEQNLRKQAAEKARARALEEQKEIEALEKAYSDLANQINEKVQAARLDQLQGIERLDAEKDIAEQGLRLLEQNAVKAAELAGKSDQDIHDIHLKFLELRKALDRQYAESVFQINAEIKANTIENFEEAQKSFLPGPELATDFKKALGDALKPEEVFSEFEQGLIDYYGPELGRKMIESIRKGADGAVAQNDSNDPFAKLRKKLVDALGIEDDELQPIIESFKVISDTILAGIDSQIEANDRLLDSLREQSETVEEELEKQKGFKEQGFANDVTLSEMKLAQLKKDEEKVLQEQKKLRKQREIIETGEQIGSLITASANIYKAFSALGPIGVALSIAAIGLMFSTFIATKARAKQATRAYKGGALSDYLGNRNSDFVSPGGPSDIPGRGDGYRVEGTNLLIGGDEFLMSEGPAREHAKFLRKMNKGKYKGVDLERQLAFMSTKQPNFAKINAGFEERQRSIDRRDAELNYLAVRDGVTNAISNQTSDLIRYFSKQKKIAPFSKDGYVEYSDRDKTIVKFMKD